MFAYPRFPRKASSAPSHERAPWSATATQMGVARRWNLFIYHQPIPVSFIVIQLLPCGATDNFDFNYPPEHDMKSLHPSRHPPTDVLEYDQVFWGKLGRRGGNKGYRTRENRDRSTRWKDKWWRSWIVGYLMSWIPFIVRMCKLASTVPLPQTRMSLGLSVLIPFTAHPRTPSSSQRLDTAPSRSIRHCIVFW